MGDLNHANELVALIRQQFGDRFRIRLRPTLRCIRRPPNFNRDLDNPKRKGMRGRLGDHPVLLQRRCVCKLIDACERRSIDIPVVPGIIPITNSSNLVRFQMPAARRFPLAAQSALEGLRRRHGEHPQNSAPRWSPTCMAPARHGCTCLRLHHEPGRADAGDLGQPGPDAAAG